MKTLLSFVAATVLLSSPAFAESKMAGQIMTEDAKAFETSPGMRNGAVFLTVMNHGDTDDRLLSVSSPAADHAEIHQMSETNGVMKMRKVDSVTIKGGDMVTFAPNGYHIMLMGLKAPLKDDAEFPLTLQFEKAGTLETKFDVMSRADTKKTPVRDMGHMGH